MWTTNVQSCVLPCIITNSTVRFVLWKLRTYISFGGQTREDQCVLIALNAQTQCPKRSWFCLLIEWLQAYFKCWIYQKCLNILFYMCTSHCRVMYQSHEKTNCWMGMQNNRKNVKLINALWMRSSAKSGKQCTSWIQHCFHKPWVNQCFNKVISHCWETTELL